jgi:hypothetical protein
MNPSFGVADTSGFKLSDDVNNLVLTFSTIAEQTSDVGEYPINASSINPNYAIFFDPGTLSITPAPLTVQLFSFLQTNRTYGDAPVDFRPSFQVTSGLLFGAQQRDVVRLVDPTDATTPIGLYAYETEILDPNYEVVFFENDDFAIQQRVIDLVFVGANRAYGDPDPDLFSFLQTTGLFAPGEGPADVLATPRTTANINSNLGSYPISTSSINSNYFVNSITGDFTIRQRLLDLVFSGATRFLGQPNPDLFSFLQTDGLFVFGDTAADVLATPTTTANIDSPVGSYPIQTRSIDSNYVVRSITGELKVERSLIPSLPLTPDTDVTLVTDLVLTTSGTIDSSGFTVSERESFDEPTKLTIRGTKPPGLGSLFAGGDYSIGFDMIENYFALALDAKLSFDTSEGSLFYQITGSTEGTVKDVTPALIQSWLERNMGDPAAMASLAEPLAEYTKTFLLKDPARYTESEANFASLLSEHMGQARDELAEGVEANFEAWKEDQALSGPEMAQIVFSGDVPWKDFVADAAGSYVEVKLEESLAVAAVTVGASSAVSAAVGTSIMAYASSIFPYAAQAAAIKAASTGAAAGAAAAGTGVSASAAAFPVAVAIGVVVGSVVRADQVFKGEEQKAVYEGIVDGVGTEIEVHGFSTMDDKGKEDTYKSAILFGALSNMLFAD